MDHAPWWLPDNWLVVALAILGGVVVTQIWKLHCRYRFGRKPRRYLIATMSILFTGSLLVLLGWLDDQPIKTAIRTGILWAFPSPLLWLAAQAGLRKWFPELACNLGEDRRAPRGDKSEWTEEQRELYRRGLFEDTCEIVGGVKQVRAAKKERGFLSLTLVAIIAGGALVALLGVQSWRLSQAHEALGAERVGKELAMEAVARLTARTRAAEASLAERDTRSRVIDRRATVDRQKLAEVKDESCLDAPIAPAVVRLLADRRGGGHADTEAAGKSDIRLPKAGLGATDVPRSGPAIAGHGGQP